MSTPRLSVLASVYRGEKYLPAYLLELQRQTLFPQLEVLFVCNEPSATELQTVQAFKHQYPQQVQILNVHPKETLGASWNRAWKLAQAPFLAIWNIDDRRMPDSLERQVTAIETYDWALCYGDYVAVAQYGDTLGRYFATPPYEVSHFQRAFAQSGAFWVLEKHVAARLGYFDEQLRVAADMDYSFRMAANKLQMGRVDGLLGFFTDASEGLSTREGGREAILERTVVQLRYGVYDKVRPEFRAAAQAFNLDSVQNFGGWRPLTELVPDYAQFLARRKPLWLLANLRAGLRSLLAKTGLLRWVHALQNKLYGKEI